MVITSTISPSLKMGLRVLGLWPDMPYIVVNKLLFISSIIFIQWFQYLYILEHLRISELPKLVNTLSLIMYYSLTLIKLLILWKNRCVIHQILADIDDDWRDYMNVDHHLQLMKNTANMSHLYTKIWYIYNLLSGSIYFGIDNAIAIIYPESNNGTSRPFPVAVKFPFEAEQSPTYELLVTFIFLHALVMVNTVATINSLISALVLHTTGQIDIIHQQLRTICDKVSYYESSQIGLLIEKHNKVILFSENVDKIFSFIALLQVFSNTVVTCFLGFIVMTSVNTENDANIVKALVAYAGITMEIFVYCFAGEYLSFKSKSLGDAGYESSWYNMPPNYGKNILFIIMRCQKQMTITAGGMLNLSLESYASLLKASASYMSVLHAVY